MEILIGIVIYLLMGIFCSRLAGFKGLVEILLWPMAIIVMIYVSFKYGYWLFDDEDIFNKKDDK